jgi:EpsI family protein
MRNNKSGFLGSGAAKILTAVLLAQAALLYGFARGELIPVHTPLKSVPPMVGSWTMAHEGVVEEEVQEVLRADDLITRSYENASIGRSAHLFVAYFKSQRAGQTPHSPKNCMPGSGWVPMESGEVTVPVPGRNITVNRYLVGKGEAKTLVYYWYQSRDRVVAEEYAAKFYVLADAIRYNRTDTALVRVTVPLRSEEDIAAADKAAVDFIGSMFVPLRGHFPA